MSFYRDFSAVYERIFPVRDSTVRFLNSRLGEAPGRVLDAGCGPGHLLARLPLIGHVGIDLDPEMIARGRDLHRDLDLRVLDLRRVGELDLVFDAAVCLGNVLPHLDRIDVAGFLGTLHHCLAPGATWVVQTVNFDRLQGRETWSFPVLEIDDFRFERRYVGLDGSGCRFLTRLLRDGETLFEGDVAMTALTTDEFLDRHRAAGFDLVSMEADFAGTPFEPAASPGRVAVFRRDLTA